MKSNQFNQTVIDVGEFGLIERLQRILPSIKQPEILLGIGDDTAAIALDANRVLLMTCDIQIENQHFRLAHITPYQLGRRALAVNLSDVAAMGGRPTYALISLGFPATFPTADFDMLFEGIRDQAAECGVLVVGGNLSQTRCDLVIDITLLGETTPGALIRRSGAQVGDRILVTGTVGASAMGFYILEKFGNQFPEAFSHCVKAHLEPVPRVTVGQEIARAGGATAMIDLSDGIASDLDHLCKQSQVGATIFQSALPLPSLPVTSESPTSETLLQLALHGGEDYELLFTVRPDLAGELIARVSMATGVQITEIGRIEAVSEGFHLIDRAGERIPIQPKGWDHFNPKHNE